MDLDPFSQSRSRWPGVLAVVIVGAFVAACIALGFGLGMLWRGW